MVDVRCALGLFADDKGYERLFEIQWSLFGILFYVEFIMFFCINEYLVKQNQTFRTLQLLMELLIMYILYSIVRQ